MVSDGQTPAKTALSSLLSAYKITRFVYVDDYFANDPNEDVENIIGKFQHALENSQDDARKIVPLPWSVADEDIWKIELRNHWDAASNEEKLRINQSLSDLLNPRSEKDKIAIDGLQSLIEGLCEYRPIRPSEWNKQREQILAEVSEQGRALCLFDQDLSAETGFTSTGSFSGGGLVKELTEDSRSTHHIVCGIFTHKINAAEEEYDYQQTFADANQVDGLDTHKYLPLAKSRIGDPIQFADGIKKLLLNELSHKRKKSALGVLETAHGKAKEAIEKLDVFAFDRMVLKAAVKANEDIWEIDTILRLYQIHQVDATRTELYNPDTAKALNGIVAQIRPISDVETIKDDYTLPRVRKVRKAELYESSDLIRHRPLETGDVFELTTGGKIEHYLLLTQPCDLAVRLNGSRVNEIVSLIPIVCENSTSSKGKDKTEWHNYWSTQALLDSFCEDAKQLAILQFKRAVSVRASVLDLAILNANGECNIDIMNTEAIPGYLTTGWQKRLESVQAEFRKLSATLNEYKNLLSSKDEGAARDLLISAIPQFSFPQIFPEIPYENGVFNFQLKRISRYRQPYAEAVLKLFTQYLSREARALDFAS